MSIADFITANSSSTQSTVLSSTAGGTTTGFSGGWQLLDFSSSEDGATIDTVSLFLRYGGTPPGGSIDLYVDLYELDAAVHGPNNTNAWPGNIPELSTGTPIETSAAVTINSPTIAQTDFSFSSTIDSSKYYYVWIKESGTSGADASIQFDFGVGDNATGQWERYQTASQTGDFTTAQGYSMATNAGDGATVAFTGAMKTTTQSISIVDNNDANEGAGRRWNLVSNPYPSYIFGNAAAGANNFLDLNTTGINQEYVAVYGWNGSGYTTYNNLATGTDEDTPAFSIAPGQAFWVAAASTTGELVSFTPEMRTTTGTGDFVSGPQLLTYNVALKLYNGEIEKAATDFYFRDGLSLDLDPGYDAGAFNQSAKLSTRLPQGSQETAFSINAMGIDALQNTRVPLEVRQNAGQAFTISIADMELPQDIYVYLEDTLNGTLTSLKDQDFELTAQSDLSGLDRFFIVFKSNSVLSNGDAFGIEALNVYKANSDGFITITGINPELGKLNVSLYNILGQTVREKALNPTTATQTISTQGLASGLYIIQLKSGNQVFTKKIVVQ
jgi:hypothetical protein